jgi:hypothetical protein
MSYLRVGWKHQHRDEPVLLYSELDAQHWEVRKVEVFRNGRFGYASRDEAHGGTRLGLVPVPPLEVIAADPDFDSAEITQDEFEQIWAQRERKP